MNNSFNIGNLNADSSAVNIGGTIEGDQIGVQKNQAYEPEMKAAIVNLETALQKLHQKYPEATNGQLSQTLVNGLATMPQRNPQKWQRWQDILGIIFAGGIETAKVLLPPVGIPIEIVKQLYRIYERG